ncbi:AraC family transcriptional regulator [Sinomonas sp. JGH33]|uniref:AraC family transcriptional regulator n=1 Tax=Sinomonas terricola TaxID=3110330 RepID=A0ABU5T250_9MICC|nr:AraC family transcriptional regulator [Sinomonas sp. JGH33]MEA5453721.1 AraC family transcriptional regulator [Sinomonas sp. JGH33]
MDAISQLLRLARLEAQLDKHCLLGQATTMETAGHRDLEVPFHVLLEGTCELHVGSTHLQLSAGDVVLLPDGALHRITTSGAGRRSTTIDEDGKAFTTTRSSDGGSPVIDLFCGRYTFGIGAGTILVRSLPSVIHVAFGHAPESDQVLRSLSQLIRGEAQRHGEGTAAILASLCTVLLAMVLRTSSVNTDSVLWTAAAEGTVANAIAAILERPEEQWSIERLSRGANMSRATFLRHFGKSTGMTVGAFVTKARLIAAAELLDTTDATVAVVAQRVGYHSEAAFTRAFHAGVGFTPSRFRRRAHDAATENAAVRPEG